MLQSIRHTMRQPLRDVETLRPPARGPAPAALAALALLAAALGAGSLPAGDAPAAESASRPRARPAPPADGAGAERAAEDEFLKINYVFNRGLHHLALPRYERLLERYPHFARRAMVHYALALSHRALAAAGDQAAPEAGGAGGTAGGDEARRQHLAEAAAHLEAALAEPGFGRRAAALEGLGRTLLELGRPRDAQAAYRKLLESAAGEDRIRGALGLADSLYDAGEHAAAARAYEQVVESATDPALAERARFYRAASLYRQPGPEPLARAEAIFRDLASRGATYRDDALYMGALAREKAGDLEGAVERYRSLAGSETPRWRELGLYSLGAALFHLGRHEEAASHLERLRELYPRSEHRPRAELYRARAWLELGRANDAARELNRLRRDPGVGEEASLHLARAYSVRGKHATALEVLRAAAERFPGGKERDRVDLEIALELLELGKAEEAARELGRFPERHPRSSLLERALVVEAFALHRAGRYEESLALCDRLRARSPESPHLVEVSELEAENRFLAGEYAEAAALYRRHLEAFGPRLGERARLEARLRLAQCHFHGGDHARAAELLAELAPEIEALPELASEPPFAACRYLLGDALYQLERYEPAARELRAYLERAPAPRSAADARFKLAHALQLQGRSGAARAAYLEALEADPSSPYRLECELELGQIALEARDLAEARARFARVAAASPPPPFTEHALRFLGWIAAERGEHAEAAATYRRLVEEYPAGPHHAEALYQLAVELQAAGIFDEARAALERLAKEHPGAPTARKVRLQEAAALARQGKPREALERLQGLAAEPLEAELRAQLLYETAWCHRELGELELAAGAYREIVEPAAPGSPPDPQLASRARLELAELEFSRERYDAARDLLEPLARAPGPEGEQALYRLCWSLHRLGDPAGVARTHEALTSRFPESPLGFETALLAARARVAEGKLAEAAALFRSLTEAEPRPKEAELALVSWAECLNEESRFEEAERLAARFLEEYPESAHRPRAWFARGWAEEQQGRLDGAEKWYRLAAAGSTPAAARAQFQIGQCLAARKRYEDAVVEFLQVPARFGPCEWSAKALLQAAGCFEALEDPERAREYYSEVARSYAARDEGKLAEERLARLEE